MGQKDIKEKRLIAKDEVFADIYNNIVFQGEQILDSRTLESLPTESYARRTDGSWRQGNRDIRKADRHNHQYRLICGIENQEACDNTMPVRTMGYDYASYEEQIRTLQNQNQADGHPAYAKGLHDGQKLAPVVTTVLSFGHGWEGPRSLYELLDFPEAYRTQLEKLVPDYRLNLVQVDELPQEVIERLTSDFRLVAEFCVNRKNPARFRKFLKENTKPIQHPEELLELLGEVTGDRRYQEITGYIVEKKGEPITMYSVEDELEQRGMERGLEQGLERGLAQGLELVNKMLQNGEGDRIAELTENKEFFQQMCEKYLS